MITEQDFCTATTTHKIVDAQGRHWEIFSVDGYGHFPKLEVQCPGHERETITFHRQTGKILEYEEWKEIMELNHTDTRIEIPRTAT